MASAAPDTTETSAVAPSRSAARLGRRLAATVTASALLALAASDLWSGGVRRWSNSHSFMTDVISSLLVLGITVLILDEVAARRQRQDRSVSVSVQGLIVYGQALRAYNTVVSGPWARPAGAGAASSSTNISEADSLRDMREEIRGLGNVILVASPSLFDDPEARLFLEEVQRLAGIMYAAMAHATAAGGTGLESAVASLSACKSRLDARVVPLAERLPGRDRALLDGVPNPIGQSPVTVDSPKEEKGRRNANF